jgi:hypothetical protein
MTNNEEYLKKVLKYLPKYVKAEIQYTGGGYYSIFIDWDLYKLEIPGENGGLFLNDEEGAYIMFLSAETNPRKLGKLVIDLYDLNYSTRESASA